MQQSVPIHEVPPAWFVWAVSGLLIYGVVAAVALAAAYYAQLKDRNKND
jgi:hypothetical protein